MSIDSPLTQSYNGSNVDETEESDKQDALKDVANKDSVVYAFINRGSRIYSGSNRSVVKALVPRKGQNIYS